MIRLRDVSFAFPGAGPRDAVARVSLEVRDGEWLAIAGGNGAGKTTLCGLMAGILRPRAGSVETDARPPAPPRDVPGNVPGVAIAFQNPDSQFVTSSVEREIRFGLENLGLGAAEIESRLTAAARAFALEPLLHRNPHTLSGGEKQRLLLACLSGMGPRHLILDEPFSFLDAASRAAFLDCLGGTLRREGRSIVWSTVDLDEAMLADRVVFLSKAGVRFDGPPGELSRSISADELESSLVVRPRRGAEGNRHVPPNGGGKGEEGNGRCGPRALAAVELAGARFSREGSSFSLDVPSLTIAPGERVGVCGPSGSGKTTLLLGCAGLLPPARGTVNLFGARVRSRRDFPAGRAAFLFQSPEEGFFAPTVREEVSLALRRLAPGAGHELTVRRALEEAGLSPEAFLERSPFHLSQGEKRLVALASVLVLDAEIFFLDEPTIFLDGGARRRLIAALGRVSARGASIVVASHDEALVRDCADRIVRLDNGRIVGA